MIKKIKNILSDSLFKDSGLVLVSSIFVNMLNLIFWLFMVRRLSPLDYGVLNSLISVFMFFSVPASILQMVITRYTSQYMAHNQQNKAHALFFALGKRVLLFLVIVIIVLFASAKTISNFLNIEEHGLLYLVGLSALFSICSTMAFGVLSGLQKFKDMAINGTVSNAIKLLIGILLVLLGFRVWGALWGFVISFVVSLLFAYYQFPDWLKKLHKDEKPDLNRREIYSYFLPASIGTLCFFLMTNIDIILVKHYFPPLDAGFYSVAQTVGKIVLFLPSAIGVVMFPKVSDAHARNKNHRKILKKSLVAVGSLCAIVILISLFFPDDILKILTGHSQPLAISLVKFFAINMGFMALINILMLYNLSLHRMPFIYLMGLVAILQIIGIGFFHASLDQVLWVVLLCCVSLFIVGLQMIRSETKLA